MPTPHTPTEITLRLTRRLPHTREAVFRAWTDREALSRWFAPSDAYEAIVLDLDVRVGGGYRVEMRHKGGNVHRVAGKYLEIEKPSRLVFTWAWETNPAAGETLVTVELADRGGETDLQLTHSRFPDEETRASHEQGWNGCLSRLPAAC